MRQLTLAVRLRASSVFDSFYPGPNVGAVEQLQSLQPGGRPVATWLFGPAGSGKSHLLQAVCARAGATGQSAAYFPLRELAALGADVLAGCESLPLVCLDDFSVVAGDGSWEREVFRLYTLLEDHGGNLLIAADSAPTAARVALKDLSSRLAAGTVLRLQALDDHDQAEALCLRARQLGLELPLEGAQYLMRRLPRDMSTLCDTLDRLDQASLATGRRLTIPLIRGVLDEPTSEP